MTNSNTGSRRSSLNTCQYNIFFTCKTDSSTIFFLKFLVTCIFAENVCALSCYSTSAERNEEVTSLANGVKVPHSCSRLRFFASKTTEDSNEMEVIRSWSAGDKFELNDCKFTVLPTTERINEEFSNPILVSIIIRALRSTHLIWSWFVFLILSAEDAWIFINPYIWLFTIIFLSIGILVTIATSIISVMNVASNPIHIVLSIYGLFFWNGIACVLLFLVLLLWGIHFGTTISKNIAIRDTIVGDWSSDGLASLGYSYW